MLVGNVTHCATRALYVKSRKTACYLSKCFQCALCAYTILVEMQSSVGDASYSICQKIVLHDFT